MLRVRGGRSAAYVISGIINIVSVQFSLIINEYDTPPPSPSLSSSPPPLVTHTHTYIYTHTLTHLQFLMTLMTWDMAALWAARGQDAPVPPFISLVKATQPTATSVGSLYWVLVFDLFFFECGSVLFCPMFVVARPNSLFLMCDFCFGNSRFV